MHIASLEDKMAADDNNANNAHPHHHGRFFLVQATYCKLMSI
jgi:hypothetical protein